ncbi:hypothetical protein C8R43DRAFT_1121576 [Mycena crocata]|nr:hypothetical protein C8R43DRAFT_1121576 [Mycena crocata]
MPAGRKPLSAELKAERRQASLRRYAEKNSDTLRTAGRLRMRKKRDEVKHADSVTIHRYQAMDRRAAQAYRYRYPSCTQRLLLFNGLRNRQRDASEEARRLSAEKETPIAVVTHRAPPPANAPATTRSSTSSNGPATGVSRRKKPGHLLSLSNAIDKGKERKPAAPPPLDTPCPPACHHIDNNSAGDNSDDSEAEMLWGESWGDVGPRPRMRPRIREPTPHCDKCGEAYCCGCSCMCQAADAVWFEHGKHMARS